VFNICFDTGTLFYPACLRELAGRSDVRLWGSTINVFETVSDVRDDDSFRRVRAQLSLLLEVSGDRFLPNTDMQFRIAVGHPDVIDTPLEWREIAMIVAQAGSLAELEHVSFRRAAEMRAEHTNGWPKQVVDHMLRSINPTLTTSPDWNVRATADTIAKLRAFLHSPDGRHAQLNAWFRRQRWDPSQISMPERVVSLCVLRAYFQAWEGFLLHMLQFGRKPEENDALDLDQTLPLWQDDWLFLTSDKGLVKCLELGEMPRHKYRLVQTLNSSDWIASARKWAQSP